MSGLCYTPGPGVAGSAHLAKGDCETLPVGTGWGDVQPFMARNSPTGLLGLAVLKVRTSSPGSVGGDQVQRAGWLRAVGLGVSLRPPRACAILGIRRIDSKRRPSGPLDCTAVFKGISWTVPVGAFCPKMYV